MVSRGNTIPTKLSSALGGRGHRNARRSGHTAAMLAGGSEVEVRRRTAWHGQVWTDP
jgi:hypothetical protein